MTNDDKLKQEAEDLEEQLEEELNEIQDEEGQIDEEKLEEVLEGEVKDETNTDFSEKENKSKEDESYKDRLIKVQADFDNYKKRVARDKDDMIFFLKSDILSKVLPRIDDLERIIKNTPEDLQQNPLFEGINSVLTKLLSDLEKL
ncbi:MAG: nucleotide exchange factor GrpE [Candidatus Peribacteria bacterium]|jgi:molecular chaperone GrpE|nr:nucleotide exchange factor GrpE [Candidatus Peribacteria bacterium]